MENNDRIYGLRFGEVAVLKGFITASRVKEALAIQISNLSSATPRSHKLIGEILHENGWMTFEQILIVLEELSVRRKTAHIR